MERDKRDGAQARLVALTMHLGRAEARLEDRPETAALIRPAREEAPAAGGQLAPPAPSLTNAVKHAPGASVRIAIRRSGPRLVVGVSDDGPGGADPRGNGLSGLRPRGGGRGGTLGVG